MFTKARVQDPRRVAIANAAERTAAIERDVEETRARRARLVERLTGTRARSEGLAAEIAQAVATEAEPKSLAAQRRERLALGQEVEELELAVTVVDERIAALEAARERARRRALVATALHQLDRLADVAARLDEAWGPMVGLLEELLLVERDTADLLNQMYQGRGRQYRTSGRTLAACLLWRVADLLDGIPRADASERGPVRQRLAHEETRLELEQELELQEEDAR
jgi:hypothetical protein